MQYDIIAIIKTQLQKIPNLYVGYYPYDYDYITNKLPSVLIKFSNGTVFSSDGHHNYQYDVYTQFMLYITDTLQNVLDMQQSIIYTIIQTLHNQSTYCVLHIGQTTIQTGDITEFIDPSTPGYNANIIVRKITQNYKIKYII